MDFYKLWIEGPWNFNKNTIGLATWKLGTSPEVVEFLEVKFWTQFHGVPWDHFTDSVAKVLAKRMGTFKMVDHAQ